jgi:hypothetical protein
MRRAVVVPAEPSVVSGAGQGDPRVAPEHLLRERNAARHRVFRLLAW